MVGVGDTEPHAISSVTKVTAGLNTEIISAGMHQK